jgi:hypothetical protein
MQKFVFRSALRPNQILFSHSQDPISDIRPVVSYNSLPRLSYPRHSKVWLSEQTAAGTIF